MSPAFDIGTVINALLSLGWVVVLLIVAGVALLRLRTSAAGILLGGAFALWAIERLVVFIASTFIPPLLDDPSAYLAAQSLVIHLLTLVELLAIGAGIALIPRALKGRPQP